MNTTVTHGPAIRAAGSTITVQRMHDDYGTDEHVILEASDEPLAPADVRQLAAALLEAADLIDGQDSNVVTRTALRDA